ncbi:MAG: hypothetical protein AAFP92_05190 [Bacteroidota bacterium]
MATKKKLTTQEMGLLDAINNLLANLGYQDHSITRLSFSKKNEEKVKLLNAFNKELAQFGIDDYTISSFEIKRKKCKKKDIVIVPLPNGGYKYVCKPS